MSAWRRNQGIYYRRAAILDFYLHSLGLVPDRRGDFLIRHGIVAVSVTMSMVELVVSGIGEQSPSLIETNFAKTSPSVCAGV